MGPMGTDGMSGCGSHDGLGESNITKPNQHPLQKHTKAGKAGLGFCVDLLFWGKSMKKCVSRKREIWMHM
jgi:hypothetical protein